MDARTFYNTVVLMRRYQREYFRTKSSSALQYSKNYEKIIDEEIKRVEKLQQEKQNPKLQL